MNMMHPHLLLALFMTVNLGQVFAADGFPPAQWPVKCSHKNKTFELFFNSVSGDITEDDMSVSFKTTQGKIIPLPTGSCDTARMIPESALWKIR